MKLRLSNTSKRAAFFCPGCEEYHTIGCNDGVWTFNNDLFKPTFNPSLLIKSGHYANSFDGKNCWCTYYKEHKYTENEHIFKCTICHSFIREGKIQFLNDCTHKLKGQTVDLPEFELQDRKNSNKE